MDTLRRGPRQSSELETPIWTIKIALLLTGILLTACATWFGVPAAAGAIFSGAPKLWTSAKSWLSPPYLFIAVHLIIVVIWKLSDYQKHWDQWSTPESAPQSPEITGKTLKARAFDDSPAAPLFRNPSPDLWHEISPQITAAEPPTPLTDYSIAAPAVSEPNSTAPPVVELKQSIAAASQPEHKTTTAVAATVASVDAEDDEENESMEDTWKLIMEKSSPRPKTTSTTPRSAFSIAVEQRDEMNRRFDDFIKVKRDQLRLERDESNQRRILAATMN